MSSRSPASTPASGALEQVISPRARDLGEGFVVQRVLPAATRRTVGPFVFFDQMGPVTFAPAHGVDVRPHPHIGLATLTYLFDGELLHRDSLGTTQLIRPQEVNWMIAGRGIAHSERTPAERRTAAASLSGIQVWIGLPQAHEETAPVFTHHAADELPLLEREGVRLRLIAGALHGLHSPVPVLSPLFYADARLSAGATLELEAEYAERAIFIASGTLEIGRQPFGPGLLLVSRSDQVVQMKAPGGARLLLLGGAPLDGPRYVWWNFVSSSRERIARAADDWRAGRFGAVPGEHEFIPLPDTPLPPAIAAEAARPVDYP